MRFSFLFAPSLVSFVLTHLLPVSIFARVCVAAARLSWDRASTLTVFVYSIFVSISHPYKRADAVVNASECVCVRHWPAFRNMIWPISLNVRRLSNDVRNVYKT